MFTNGRKRLIFVSGRISCLPACLCTTTIYPPALGLTVKLWIILGVKAACLRAATIPWLFFC